MLLITAAATELWWSGNAPWGLALPLTALLVAGWLLTRSPASAAGWVALVTGAVLIGVGPASVPGGSWVRAGSVAGTVAGGFAFVAAEGRWRSVVLPLLTVSAIGIYGTAPDTERSAVLLTVLAAATAVGWWVSGLVGPVGAPALAGMVVWVIAVDGRGSHASVIGSFGCLGVLLLGPIAQAAGGAAGVGRRPGGRWPALLALAALQAAIVIACHAVGVSRSVPRAAAGTAAALGLAAVVVALGALLVPHLPQLGTGGKRGPSRDGGSLT